MLATTFVSLSLSLPRKHGGTRGWRTRAGRLSGRVRFVLHFEPIISSTFFFPSLLLILIIRAVVHLQPVSIVLIALVVIYEVQRSCTSFTFPRTTAGYSSSSIDRPHPHRDPDILIHLQKSVSLVGCFFAKQAQLLCSRVVIIFVFQAAVSAKLSAYHHSCSAVLPLRIYRSGRKYKDNLDISM